MTAASGTEVLTEERRQPLELVFVV